jgi:hypothetical protein
MEPDKAAANGLKLPLKFCQVKQSKLRFPGADPFRDSVAWEKRAEDWNFFWKSLRKKEGFAKSGDIIIGGMSFLLLWLGQETEEKFCRNVLGRSGSAKSLGCRTQFSQFNVGGTEHEWISTRRRVSSIGRCGRH